MKLPRNPFKDALKRGTQQIGLWNVIPNGFVAEALAGAGFDWMLIDTEHSPDPITVLPVLQAIASYDVAPVVRPAANDPVLIKRLLDIGAQSLLVPYVQDEQEAVNAVSAMRYPPEGIRGVSGITRATRFGRVSHYARDAHSELCLIVQVETRKALTRIEAIAQVDGVDAVFIGPADLAASLGYPGMPAHPAVISAVEDAIERVTKSGKPAGILTPNADFARRCISLGTTFTAIGLDIGILLRGAENLAAAFRDTDGQVHTA